MSSKSEFPHWEDVIGLLEELIGVEITFREDREFNTYGWEPAANDVVKWELVTVQAVVGTIKKLSVTCECKESFLKAEVTIHVNGTQRLACIEQHYCEDYRLDQYNDPTWECGTEETAYKPGWLRFWIDSLGPCHISKQMLLPYMDGKKKGIYFYLVKHLHSDCTLLILNYIQS